MNFKEISKWVIVVILDFSLLSCSSSQFINYQNESERNYKKLNYQGERYSSTIYFLDGSEKYSDILFVQSDSLYYRCYQDSVLYKFSLNNIEKVVITDYTLSFFSGFFIGLGSALLAGIITAGSGLGGKGHPNLAPLGAMILAFSIGLIIGFIASGERKFVFNEVLPQ